MGGNQIGHQILLLFIALVQLLVLFLEFFIDPDMGLAHIVQGVGHAVLRGHLQLARDVVLHQVGEELPAGVLHQVVKADTGADKDLFDPWDLPQAAQEPQIIHVVRVQVGAGLGGQTGPVFAEPMLQLLLAGGPAEGGRGPAHVVDIALEILIGYKALCLSDNVFFAALLNYAPLVKCDSAIVARSETPSHGSQRIFDLFYRRHSPRIAGVKSPLVR